MFDTPTINKVDKKEFYQEVNTNPVRFITNIGGMGTIIASLASVISYKLYIKENPESNRRYLFKFSIYNLISLVVFTFIGYFIVVYK